MFDARTTELIATTPEAVLEFIMDVEQYAEVDEKIRPLLWTRRGENFTEFAFRPKLAGLVGPTLVSQERLVPEHRRVDISLAPAPHNRLIRKLTEYEASFECVPVPGGTEVTRSERFRLRRPFNWLAGPYLKRRMPELVRRELRLAKHKLEGTPIRSKGIPGPRRLAEQIRLARLLARSPAEGLSLLHDRYGSIVRFGFGPFRYIAMLGPEANKFILGDRPDLFRWREAMSFLIPVDGDTAMVVSDGEDHQRRRHAAQQAFAAKRIHRYLDIMIDEFHRELSGWPVGGRVVVREALRRAIKRITTRSLFGDHLDSSDELGAALDTTIGFVNQPMWRQFKVDLPWTFWHRAVVARKRTDEIVYAEIARRRRLGPPPEAERDVLDILLAAQNADGGPALTDQEVRDQVVSLIAASYDTIGSAGSWAVHELLANPEVRAKAAGEVAEVLGDERLTMDTLGRLPYVDAIVNEVLRMWPPTSVSPRTTAESFEFDGVTVPAGVTVLHSPYVTHHLPELWPDPDTFRPQRWADGRPEPYTFVPFGGGYRRCIGFIFATQQLKVLVVELLRTLELTQDYTSVVPVGIPALHPGNGLPVRVVSRRTTPIEEEADVEPAHP